MAFWAAETRYCKDAGNLGLGDGARHRVGLLAGASVGHASKPVAMGVWAGVPVSESAIDA